MSAEKEREPAEDARGRPIRDESTSAKPEPPELKGLDYVFKIRPADPKSSFDFEDVADK